MKIGVIDAVLWTLGVTAAINLAPVLVVAAVPRANEDLVMLTGVEVVVYLGACALYAARRPGSSWSELFAVRRTSLWLGLFAVLLGVFLYLPAATLAGWVERLAPLHHDALSERAARLVPRSVGHGIALGFVAGGLGPFVEELLFRGALYTGLRPVQTAVSAAWTTGMLFTLSHPEPRLWPSILGLSAALGFVRASSGSLWPGLFLHAAFNGTALAMAMSGRESAWEPAKPVVIGSAVGAALVLGAIVWVARASARAERARELDLERGPEPRETLP